MDPLLQFLLALAIIIMVAKAAGYLSVRLGQPAVLGQLLAGVVLGATVLDMLHWPLLDDPHLPFALTDLSYLGAIVLMFIAGLEMDMEGMVSAGRPALLSGLMGVVAPVVMGMMVALPFGFGLQQSLFIGVVLAATSVSISAQCLMELDLLRSREGACLLGSAVVDDVLVILLLSLLVALAGGGGQVSAVLWVLFRMTAFLGLAVWLGARVIPGLTSLMAGLPISEAVMALALVVTLLYSWAAEALGGMAAITGAFLAGLVFGRTPWRQQIENGMHTLAYAWLVPVFFVSVGLESNARALGLSDLPFATLLILVAILSKILGCGIGARLGGFSNMEALRLGAGMVSRGEVALIVATVGLREGLIADQTFASFVLMVIVTTVAAPVMLRALHPDAAGGGPG